ncbi:hypothetical protein ACOSQ4_005144 [Xanthoceras sorbifolium]
MKGKGVYIGNFCYYSRLLFTRIWYCSWIFFFYCSSFRSCSAEFGFFLQVTSSFAASTYSSAASSSSSAAAAFFFRRNCVLLPPQPPSSSTAAKSSSSPATFQRQPNLVHIFLH